MVERLRKQKEERHHGVALVEYKSAREQLLSLDLLPMLALDQDRSDSGSLPSIAKLPLGFSL